ncbi:type III polyketide synthase [Micromonospora sagamiensis]|uniref:Isopalmitoylresorcinol synthase n=1 Tax=Micromonospora sagamiensis TaxID=47875 RepID=A0A562WCU5_9ACTN|nr:type III polyketide synthase [Micromonospora sagamiensis]TWJ27851.1 isopalmitoylresorcinol synthase [Micromonospora sagamiensis]BCL13259.1 chalcone synthase [Micromonospora sagamiensis]
MITATEPIRAARIVGLRTAQAGPAISQREMFDSFYKDLYADVPDAEKLFMSTQVNQRRMLWPPKENYGDGWPGMQARIEAWEQGVLAMGRETVGGVLDGVETDRVGSFTFVSCTGYAGPTPEMLLAKEFGLRKNLRRTFVGHMGCYAAFNGLKVALDSLAGRPDELALVTCAEVCSVHLRPEATKEQVVVTGLFGDASATLLLEAVQGDVDAVEGPVVLGTHTETHPETSAAMTWKVMDDAFRMTLSPYVPLYLAETIRPFVGRLLEPHGLEVGDVTHWGIHPGGPKIIDFVGDRLELPLAALRPSLEILNSWGNCSSPTVLLILEQILRTSRPKPGEYGVLMAFGPGLTMESALVRF